MINRLGKIFAVFVLIALLSWTFAEGKNTMAGDKILYRVSLENDKAKTVVVKQSGKNLMLELEGFGQPISLTANGGGVETCRTTIKHKSEKATITLSLPIPKPNVPCQMLPGFVSVESETYKISMSDEFVKKDLGSDTQLRKLVEKYFGKSIGK